MTFMREDFVDIFIVDYDITFKKENDFQYQVECFILSSGKYLILDLTKVMYLNNSALGIIAHTSLKAKQYNKELVIAGNRPPLNEIFEIVNFNIFTPLFATRDEAIEYFRCLEKNK